MLRLSLIFLLLFTSACSKEKTVDSVFPKLNTNICPNQNNSQFVVEWEDGSIMKIEAESREKLIEDFVELNLEKIKRVESDYIFEVKPFVSSDTSASAVQNWHHIPVNSVGAWNQNARGQGVVVAVIDSGVDIYHSDIRDNIAINTGEIPNNGIDDDDNGYVDDVKGWDFYDNTDEVTDPAYHGTHVAGIIAAKHWQNITSESQLSASRNVYGIAPDVKILPIRFLGPQGQGNLSDAIQAVEYAAIQEVDVINASWGGTQCSQILNDKIIALQNQGIVFVTAAGNDRLDVDQVPVYPGVINSPNLINVAATSERGPLASFSNFGLYNVHVGAPGENIMSTIPGNRMTIMSGTSMAAPIVAGMAAILKSVNPNARPDQIKGAIVSTVRHSNLMIFSRGTIDIERAIQSIR